VFAVLDPGVAAARGGSRRLADSTAARAMQPVGRDGLRPGAGLIALRPRTGHTSAKHLYSALQVLLSAFYVTVDFVSRETLLQRHSAFVLPNVGAMVVSTSKHALEFRVVCSKAGSVDWCRRWLRWPVDLSKGAALASQALADAEEGLRGAALLRLCARTVSRETIVAGKGSWSGLSRLVVQGAGAQR
jgi:hypothetical protein